MNGTGRADYVKRSTIEPSVMLPKLLSGVLLIASSLALAAGLIAAWGLASQGSTFAMLQPARQGGLSIAPAEVDFGMLLPGQTARVSVEAKNSLDKNIVIIGGKTFCSGISVDGLPAKVPASGSLTLTLSVTPKTRETSLPFKRTIYLYTNIKNYVVPLAVSGTVSADRNED